MKTNTTKETTGEDYRTLVDELATLTDAHNRLAALDARFQEAHAELVAEMFRADYAELQEAVAAARERVETLALKHPEWFEKSKTVKTPFGSVAFRSTTKLEVRNEEMTLALADGLGKPELVREKRELNREALETLDDGELKALKVKRVTSEKCTITPAKVDLGKAVAAGEQAKKN